MWVDHAEPKSKIQAEQVQKEYDGPQALSCMDTNLDEIKESPDASNHHHWILFIILSYLWFLDVH
jgi:hypothetical protein